MSYILDALRRADAQRRQGQAPGLQQIAAAPAFAPGAGRSRRARPWVRAVAVSALLAAAALASGWWWGRMGARTPATPNAPAASTVSTVSTTSAASAVSPTAARPADAPEVAPAAPPRRAKPQPPPLQKPRTEPTAPAPPAAAALAAAALPEPLRSRVGALSFGGAVQSQDRHQSFVLMSGQIVREGETLAPGIVLERIGARSLLLRVDGQAVELPL
ncbi:MAG TPA: general secretion pathway protein GspB [Rubrivivax sp.]|nr:general secretion pathway protein GspB [Burkholderiales bacterium]HNT39416.1 general secretion pathway protein GspB [Rubrivivax sp.]